MKSPVLYFPSFIASPDAVFDNLWNGLDWERRGDAPRREYFASLIGEPYTYGRGAGMRTYYPRPWTMTLYTLRVACEEKLGVPFELVFLNGYADHTHALGWHADNSPEMDDARPIAILSFGAERDIYFRKNGAAPDAIEKLRLGNGSLCVMSAGMQDTHQHKIPKGDRPMGPRISLTFRGYAAPQSATI